LFEFGVFGVFFEWHGVVACTCWLLDGVRIELRVRVPRGVRGFKEVENGSRSAADEACMKGGRSILSKPIF